MTSQLLSQSQLRWRCRRGMQELDILLLRYLDQQYEHAEHAQKLAFAALLQQQDDVLWDWLSGRDVPEQPVLAQLVAQITQMRC